MTKTALARRLGLSEGAVRKLLDPDHRSHIGQVEKALKVLGQSLVTPTGLHKSVRDKMQGEKYSIF